MIGVDMTEESFLKILEEYLSTELPSLEVRQNIQYYRDYITASRSTKSEDEVMKALGDPRLIAKTIIDTYRLSHDAKHSYSRQETYQSSHTGKNYRTGEVERDEKRQKSSFKVFGSASRLTLIASVVILFLIFGIILWVSGIILKLLIRFVLPVIIILIGVNWIRKQFRK
jgi:uncharacterized membrane protein